MSIDVISRTGKRGKTGEIIVTLFEYCDLNCKFCSQDHNSFFGIDTILEKIDIIKGRIKSLPREDYSVHFMGGEVFADALPDRVFQDYGKVIRELNNWAFSEGINLEICFTTNFVFTNTERFDIMLGSDPVTLLTSYDPSARFNKTTFPIFQENVRRYRDYIKSVNVIMTKPSIRKFMRDDVPFFEYLYDRFGIYFDYYTPEANMDTFLPNDIMLRDFILYMLDKYPKVLPFNDMQNKVKKQMTCMDTVTILPDGTSGPCTILVKDLKRNYQPSKFEMEEKWFKQYNCLECAHFQYCNMGCFLSNHIQSFRTQDTCFLSEVYDVVHPDTR